MNEPTLSPEVPDPASIAGSGSIVSTEAVPQVASSDQLPTVRFQALPPPLPPPRAPVGPAHTTQPLRPITREAALAAMAEPAPPPISRALHVAGRTGAALLSPLRAFASAPWTARRVGITCVASGLVVLVGSLVAGWEGVASVHYETSEHASVAVALLLARTFLAVATMGVGCVLLRIGERTLRLRRAGEANRSEID